MCIYGPCKQRNLSQFSIPVNKHNRVNCEREREREREREGGRGRETETETDRQTDRQTEKYFLTVQTTFLSRTLQFF